MNDTLDDLKSRVENWRSRKHYPGEPMPKELKDDILGCAIPRKTLIKELALGYSFFGAERPLEFQRLPKGGRVELELPGGAVLRIWQ